MGYAQDVPWFITFHDLNPYTSKSCIFYTLKGKRCKQKVKKEDKASAEAAYTKIHALLASPKIARVSLEILEEYALNNCCTRSKHREYLEDHRQLKPLARRWQNEIQCYIEEQQSQLNLKSVGKDHAVADHVGYQEANDEDGLNPDASPQVSNTASASESMSAHDALETMTRPTHVFSSTIPAPHNLCSHPHNNTHKVSGDCLEDEVQSEFRPRKSYSGFPATVASCLRRPLTVAQSKSGAIYIYSRTSSPGHVKIGYTSKSVGVRMAEWALCRYTPNPVAEYGNVPNVWRVETLIHYELYTEWRTERKCKGCGTSHKEWFEVSQERAKEVAQGWVTFMTLAKPYNAQRYLEEQWSTAICRVEAQGKKITAEALLQAYQKWLDEEEARLDAAAVPVPCERSMTGNDDPLTSDGSANSAKVDDTEEASEASTGIKQERDSLARAVTASSKTCIPIIGSATNLAVDVQAGVEVDANLDTTLPSMTEAEASRTLLGQGISRKGDKPALEPENNLPNAEICSLVDTFQQQIADAANALLSLPIEQQDMLSLTLFVLQRSLDSQKETSTIEAESLLSNTNADIEMALTESVPALLTELGGQMLAVPELEIQRPESLAENDKGPTLAAQA